MNLTAQRVILLMVGAACGLGGLLLLLLTPYYWPVLVPMVLIGVGGLAAAFLASDDGCEEIIRRVQEGAKRVQEAIKRAVRRK